MRKSIFIFLFILVFFSSGCSKNENTIQVFNESNIFEEMKPIRDNKGNFLGIDVLIEIPSSFNKKEILINSNIFEGISQYEDIVAGKKYIVNFKINNKSIYDYSYKTNSFEISTKEITNTNNYLDTGAVGFDLLKIYDLYQPYRTKNSALLKLIENDNLDLTDAVIDKKLKDIGYQGIDDLTKYYLDFYSSDSLYLLATEIFSGEITNYLETNREIIALAYNYFYNSLIRIGLSDNYDYSIGEFMNNRELRKLDIDKIYSNSKYSWSMFISVSDNYRRDLYKYYNFRGDFKFCLIR